MAHHTEVHYYTVYNVHHSFQCDIGMSGTTLKSLQGSFLLVPKKLKNSFQGEHRNWCDGAFFHHYQGSIDFSTANIHRTEGMYFLVSTGNRGDIE